MVMKCSCCGADLSPEKPNCEYCGSSADLPRVPPGCALFERIKLSPQYQRRETPERHAALPKQPALATVIPILFFMIFIGASLLMAAMSAVMAREVESPIPLIMALLPLSFAVLGVCLAVQFARKRHQFGEAPVLAQAAVLVAKRTAISGGSGDSSASTAYFLTAEFEDGRREEFQAMTPDVYGRFAERDAGVLFTRGSFALDFDRVAL